MSGIHVHIPTWKGADHLRRLLPALLDQETLPTTIVVIDSASPDGSADIAREHGCTVLVIPQSEFNHGGTRNRAVDVGGGEPDVLVFLTQDALPANPQFLGNLVAPVLDGTAQAAFARQLPYPEASPLEAFARHFNYPAQSALRRLSDVDRLGLKAFFFSNVASAVRRDAFVAVGGFPANLIMNEDMVLCARLLQAGGTVAYCAEAEVRHSHDYTIGQQFRRYFDIGAFLAGSNEVSGKVGGEGFRFVRGQLAWCWRNGAKSWIPRCIVEAGAKFVGMHLGKRQRFLPRWLKRRCSMHAYHWQ